MSEKKPSFWQRLRQGLAKTKQGFIDKIRSTVAGRKFDESLWEELEEILIQADVGVRTTIDLLEEAREIVRNEGVSDADGLLAVLKRCMLSRLQKDEESQFDPLEKSHATRPHVVLVVGVNGVGKTTSIGKLAYARHSRGESVLMAAADTFRAAAADQLEIWAERARADLIRHQEGADPAAVAYDALQAARARKKDVVYIDTAGRLHNKSHLMQELGKIKRVIEREVPGAPHEVLLVIDATTGQNGLEQARLFREVAGVTGIVLTKLDGTAKGGIVLAIASELGLPVHWIGVGEQIEDLQPFRPEQFLDALFSEQNGD